MRICITAATNFRDSRMWELRWGNLVSLESLTPVGMTFKSLERPPQHWKELIGRMEGKALSTNNVQAETHRTNSHGARWWPRPIETLSYNFHIRLDPWIVHGRRTHLLLPSDNNTCHRERCRHYGITFRNQTDAIQEDQSTPEFELEVPFSYRSRFPPPPPPKIPGLAFGLCVWISLELFVP